MDLDANLGADFFSISDPVVAAHPANTGTITASFNENQIGGLTTSDYRLEYDGANFSLTRLADKSVQTFAGPTFDADGISIDASGAAAGDVYLIQPTRQVARAVSVLTADTREIAAASPIRASTSLNNIGDAEISKAQIIDVTDPDLTNTISISFNDPPTTYDVNGVGPVAYISGDDIDINGLRVSITGKPEPGDSFVIEANNGGVGDNQNGLLLAGLQATGILENGSASYQDAYGQLLGDVGSQTRQAEISSAAMNSLLANAQAARDELSGVNLDEEAANLLRFQQAYQASAQLVAVGDSIFQSLLDAVGR
jgi:flagellar hook-associated protein 1 FlgK